MQAFRFNFLSKIKPSEPSEDVEMGNPDDGSSSRAGGSSTAANQPASPPDTVTVLQSTAMQLPVGQSTGTTAPDPTMVGQQGRFVLRIPGGARNMPAGRATHGTRRSRSPLSKQITRVEDGAPKKVQIVEREDPRKEDIIESQARRIEDLGQELARNNEVFEALKTQVEEMCNRMATAEERALQAERRSQQLQEARNLEEATAAERMAVAEKKVHEAEEVCALAEAKVQETTAGIGKKIRDIEDEWKRQAKKAEERVDEAERQARQVEEALRHEELRVAEAERRVREAMEAGGQGVAPPTEKALEIDTQAPETEGNYDAGQSGNARPTPAASTDVEMDDAPTHGSNSNGKGRPSSQSSGIPKPMQFSSPAAGAGRRMRAVKPSLPPPRASSRTNDTTRTSEARTSRTTSKMGLDEKVDLILETLGSTGFPTARKRKRFGPPEFKESKARSRVEGRTERLAWVRRHMNIVLGIDKDKDVLKFKEERFAENTAMKREMALYEEKDIGPGPVLEPMKPNWDKVDGKWNSKLFELFARHCIDNDYTDGEWDDEDEKELYDIFTGRLERLKTLINSQRPREDETMEDAQARAESKHLIGLARQRRHTRRDQLYNTRLNITLAYLPEDETTAVDSEMEAWFENQSIVDILGAEGMSSDESAGEDANERTYRIHHLPWRAKEITKRLTAVDNDRNTTNIYGNAKSGNLARRRKRDSMKDARMSTRSAPAKKPINFYDADWYAKLTHKQKKELQAKPRRELMEMTFDS